VYLEALLLLAHFSTLLYQLDLEAKQAQQQNQNSNNITPATMKFLAATAILLVLLATCTPASAETSSRRLLQQSTARASAAAISAGPGGVSAAYASAEATAYGSSDGSGDVVDEAGCPNPNCYRCGGVARHIRSHPCCAALPAFHSVGSCDRLCAYPMPCLLVPLQWTYLQRRLLLPGLHWRLLAAWHSSVGLQAQLKVLKEGLSADSAAAVTERVFWPLAVQCTSVTAQGENMRF
jgi:hypothetical protein